MIDFLSSAFPKWNQKVFSKVLTELNYHQIIVRNFLWAVLVTLLRPFITSFIWITWILSLIPVISDAQNFLEALGMERIDSHSKHLCRVWARELANLKPGYLACCKFWWKGKGCLPSHETSKTLTFLAYFFLYDKNTIRNEFMLAL